MKEFIILGYIDPGVGITVVGLGGGLIAIILGFLGIFLAFFKKIFKFLNKYKKPIFIGLVAVVGLTIAGMFIMNKKESAFDKRIIILGFDGLSPKIIEPMMDAGELPNFARLREEGSYRHISTTNPSQSPVAWTGFATGQNPGKSDVFDFIVRDPATYGLNLSLSKIVNGKPQRVMQNKAFWQYTSDEKIPTVILTCPVTFPPDKVYGKMTSGMGVPDILGTEGTFTFYTSEKLEEEEAIGGKVFHIKKAPLMVMNLIGPRVAQAGGKAENVKVPFKVKLEDDKKSAVVEYQKTKTSLEVGTWSDFKEVTFNLGFLKKAKGIFRFYLVEVDPDIKLYISPINFDPRDPFFQVSYPSGYSKELARDIGLYYTMGMPMDTWAVNEKRLTDKAFIEQVNMVLKEKREMLDLEFSRLDKGVLYCYFESPDIVQHMFWRFIDPEHPLYKADAPEEYKNMIKNWYKNMDDILGSVMARLRSGDTLIVLSDHGFDTFRRAAHVNSWLRENGYLKLKNPYAESGKELLMDIDWTETKAYAIGFGAIYINQEGREKKGIVKPGKETELLKEEISQKLKTWMDDKYNQPVISEVYKREEIFWGDYEENTPDLYIGFNIGYRASWQTALGASPKGLIEDNLKAWSGSHLFDPKLIPGVLFSNKRIIKEDPSLYDVAPTVLKVAGFSDEKIKECNFDGEAFLSGDSK